MEPSTPGLERQETRYAERYGMSAQRKPFEAHSARWQREARREGVTPERWNAWRKLAPSSRRDTDPRRYGQGQSVSSQRLDAKREAVVRRLAGLQGGARSERQIRIGVSRMNRVQLDRVLSMPRHLLPSYVASQARQRYDADDVNPFWYHL